MRHSSPNTKAIDPVEKTTSAVLGLDRLPLLNRPIDIAEKLDLSRSTVYNLIASGDLIAIRLGPRSMRVTRQSVIDYVDRQLTFYGD